MEFEWDETKRLSNLEKHGVDLLYAALIFDGPTLRRQDDRYEYEEVRFISLGLVDGQPFVVVHTDRDNATRLISAWKGGRRDYAAYKKSFP